MRSFPSPQLLDSFVERTVEALPSSVPFGTPDCEGLGKAWKALGLRPGDLVLLCLPNGRELLHQYFGVLMAGGVPALLPPLMPSARLREIATAMGAFAVGALRLTTGDLGAESYKHIGPLHIALFETPRQPAAAPGEVVLMTSGTSGISSGCVFDFEAILLNGQRHADAIGQRTDDTVLLNLPLYFSFALSSQALASMTRGSRLIISGPPFHQAGYQEALNQFRVTVSSLTPVHIRSFFYNEPRALRELRVLSVGGDQLEQELAARLVELRKGQEVYLTYGLTQAGPRVSTLAAHAASSSQLSSVGLPHEGTEVWLQPVLDRSGRQQLFVKSDTVMKRTIGRVEGRSNELVAARTIATGDAFEIDEDGYLFFKGRLSDFISRKGEKISLATVRRLASGLPHVAVAQTNAFRHRDGGEDYDLELRVDAAWLTEERRAGLQAILKQILRRAEMPHTITIEPASPLDAQRYK